jgi:hypothetical protein
LLFLYRILTSSLPSSLRISKNPAGNSMPTNCLTLSIYVDPPSFLIRVSRGHDTISRQRARYSIVPQPRPKRKLSRFCRATFRKSNKNVLSSLLHLRK